VRAGKGKKTETGKGLDWTEHEFKGDGEPDFSVTRLIAKCRRLRNRVTSSASSDRNVLVMRDRSSGMRAD